MPRTCICHWIVSLLEFLDGVAGGRYRRVNTHVVFAVETVYGSSNSPERSLIRCKQLALLTTARCRTVEDKRGLQAWAVCGKAKRLATTPTVTRNRDFAVSRGELGHIVSDRVQICRNLVWR